MIEGEALLPELIKEFSDKHPDNIEICFVGYTDIDIDQKLMEIRKYNLGKGDWLIQENDEYIYRHIENMIYHSRIIKESCERHNVRYIDTSVDFLASMEEATEYMLRNSKSHESI